MDFPSLRGFFSKKTPPDLRNEKELRQALESAEQRLAVLDTSSKELGRENELLREEKKKLTESIQYMRKALEECNKKNKHYEENFKKVESLRQRLMQPPLRYGIFVRPHPGAKFYEVDVLIGSEFIKAPLAIQDVSSADLKCGWEILVNGKNQVVEITKKSWTWGSAVTFRSRLSDDLAEVESGHNELQQCYLSPELKEKKLKDGLSRRMRNPSTLWSLKM